MADVRTEAMPRGGEFPLLEARRFQFESYADGMIFRVGVSRVSSDEVANPSERAARANPKARRNNQPENAGKNPAVVKLTDSGNDETENTCQNWIAHYL